MDKDNEYWRKRAEYFFPSALATPDTLEWKCQDYWEHYKTTGWERYLEAFSYLAQVSLRLDSFCTRS